MGEVIYGKSTLPVSLARYRARCSASVELVGDNLGILISPPLNEEQ